MRRSNWLCRCTLALTLACGSAALVGCENENDPTTWVKKLSNDGKRRLAVVRLRALFESRMRSTNPQPNNPRDPNVRAFLDAALPALVTDFNAHADDTPSRKDAMEILANARDPRAVPALLSALQFRPGVQDTEQIATRAASALAEMRDAIPAGDRGRVGQALVAMVERAQGSSSSMVALRVAAIRGLGAMRTAEAVPRLSALIRRPLAEQDFVTLREAITALGLIGDAAAVPALVYGYFVNVGRSRAIPQSLQAFARIGAEHAARALLETLAGRNAEIEQLMQQYRNVPNAPAVPDGQVQVEAANALRELAPAEAAPPLLALLNDRAKPTEARIAAASALGNIGLLHAGTRAEILAALGRAFNENTPAAGSPGWMPTRIAPVLAVIGDPSSVPPIVGALRNRAIQDVVDVNFRLELLGPLALIVRRGQMAEFDAQERSIRETIDRYAASGDEYAQEAARLRRAVELARTATQVARDCEDGQLACYVQRLDSNETEIARKAAYLIARTVTPAQQAEARTALLQRVNHRNPEVRRSIILAIDALSPTGCAECITRLERLIAEEQGQESMIYSHLAAQLMIARLRTRGGAAAPAAAAPPG